MVYCLGFIALTFGRMRIVCNGIEFSIYANPKAVMLPLESWKDSYKTAEILKSQLNHYFYYNLQKLPKDEVYYPGTQILLEIPVKNIYRLSYSR